MSTARPMAPQRKVMSRLDLLELAVCVGLGMNFSAGGLTKRGGGGNGNRKDEGVRFLVYDSFLVRGLGKCESFFNSALHFWWK